MTTKRQNGSLYTKISNKIATIEFGHPASNSFPSELLDRLTNELNSLSKNDSISVIILKSEGEKAFCAGASFDELSCNFKFRRRKTIFLRFCKCD